MSTSTAPATATAPAVRPRQSAVKTLFGTGVGNALEWFDWNVYATFSIYLAAALFSTDDPSSAFLKTLAVFAVGFVARPFGGLVFGWLADKVGRKHSLSLAVIFASVGSLLIAITPSYASWGAWSSALLLVARLIQGLAHGGELPSAQTYLSEQAPAERRGLWASAIYMTGTVGLLVGLALALVLKAALTDAQMGSWGWRIPFLVGAVLGLFALFIRSRMDESEVFEADTTKADDDTPKVSVWSDLAAHWKQALQVIGMTVGLTITYYIWSVSIAAVAQKSLGYTADQAFAASLIGNIVFIAVLPLWGIFSDKFGRKPAMLIAMVGAAIAYVPMLLLIQGAFWQLVVAICVMLTLLGAFLAIAPAAYAEMFPTTVRATGFGLPYSIAIAAFGGTAPYVNTWLSGMGRWHFPVYAIVALLISAATILTLKETRGKELTESVQH